VSTIADFHREIARLLRTHPRASLEGPLRDASMYVELVFRQREDALRNSFPTLKRAWEALGYSFRDLVFSYCKAHPPTSLDPNRIGDRLSQYLIDCRRQNASLPTYLEELADFETLQYHVQLEDFTGGMDLERILFVRHYSWNLLAMARANEPWKAPEPQPTTIIVCRSRHTDKRLEFVASAFDVMAIARRDGMEVGTDPRVAEADAALVHAGVLP
jgi:hypothetical protein